jgi:hypothetical protein
MAIAIHEGAGGRCAPARNTSRRSIARLAAEDGRRPVRRCLPFRVGLDDARLATIGVEGEARECVARRAFFV